MTIEKERLIYTAGTFKIDDNFARCRRIIIRSSILRKPFSAIYINERSNPPKYFLGYVSVFIGAYVYRIFPLEFEQQIVLLYDNLESQVYARVICDAININLFTAAVRATIPQPGGIIPVPGDPGTFPGCPYNFLKFKLEAGGRILVTAIGDELETCPGGEFPSIVPDLAPPPAPYPPDQARDEDPPRSQPEDGELPGDTAPATNEDPESSGAVPGIWLLTWTNRTGPNPSGSFPGLSTDTFAIVSPGRGCGLSGSSELIKNGNEVVDPAFNCNNFGFVSILVSQVFTPS